MRSIAVTCKYQTHTHTHPYILIYTLSTYIKQLSSPKQYKTKHKRIVRVKFFDYLGCNRMWTEMKTSWRGKSESEREFSTRTNRLASTSLPWYGIEFRLKLRLHLVYIVFIEFILSLSLSLSCTITIWWEVALFVSFCMIQQTISYLSAWNGSCTKGYVRCSADWKEERTSERPSKWEREIEQNVVCSFIFGILCGLISKHIELKWKSRK